MKKHQTKKYYNEEIKYYKEETEQKMDDIKIDETSYIAPGAQIVGAVSIGKNCGVWYNAVIRGDSDTVVIGDNTNIQDLACLHVDRGHKLKIGNGVTIGHSAIVHGCEIGNNVLIGMGAIIMNDAVIEDNCIIGAGALVTGKMHIPGDSMVYGNPAKIVRKLEAHEIENIKKNADVYVEHAHKAKTEEKSSE